MTMRWSAADRVRGQKNVLRRMSPSRWVRSSVGLLRRSNSHDQRPLRPASGRGFVLIAFVIALAMGVAARAVGAADRSQGAVKAGFLYNFAKFAEWRALPSGARLVFCIVGDDDVATALAETVYGQILDGHGLDVRSPQDSRTWRGCHLLYFADRETRQFGAAAKELGTLWVLTVSDGKGFSQAGGIIELFIDDGRMRFAINKDAAERAGVRLSSRLLGLAKIVR